ncbi:hypothetical protein [Burkholderia sp. 22313]|uniref:hypothetical protein n=1 Tax=Burkholderia sp. 22313 TaxID=3453908 RepID=UPI003F85B8D3
MHRNLPELLVERNDLDQIPWSDLENAIAHDDGSVAQSHLDAGRPVYIHDSSTPQGFVTKIWPNGRREHVRFDARGEISILDAGENED